MITGGKNEERTALRSLVREFARKEVLPVANELEATAGLIPQRIRTLMAEMGLFGILIPEEYGGLGLGTVEYCIVAEELARAWMSVPSLLARGNGLGIVEALSSQQRERILPRMAAGEYLGAGAISEPDAGSDVAALRTVARAVDDGWVVTGQKMWCSFADEADFILLFARTAPQDPARPRHEGVSCLILDKERGSLPEGVRGTPVRKIGYHGMKTWELSFDEVFIPRANLVGELGQGFRTAMRALGPARLHTAARAIGVARAAYEDTVEYVGVRQQFGRPIGHFQSVRFQIAEMATSIESTRRFLMSVCEDVDGGKKMDAETSMVKLAASEVAVDVTGRALHLHGGAGYTQDFPIERYWRDGRLTTIFEGTSEMQKIVISDAALGKLR